jgi:putative transposase
MTIYYPLNLTVLRGPNEPRQYLAIRYSERLEEIGAEPSVGSRGDAYDNALAEATVGLFKTELTERRGPWLSLEQLELEVARWVGWYNLRRLHEACGYLPPAEYEERWQIERQAA